MKRSLLLCTTLLIAAVPALADVAIPGQPYHRVLPPRFITHRIRFEGIKAYAKDYRFYVTNGKYPQAARSYLPLDSAGELNAKNAPRGEAELYLCALPRSLPLKKDGQPFDEYFSRKNPRPGTLYSNAFPVIQMMSGSEAETDTYLTRYKVIIGNAPATTRTDDKGRLVHGPAGKRLELALVSNAWVLENGYLLGVPVLALLGLMLRLRSSAVGSDAA